jgi:hypothetical protein
VLTVALLALLIRRRAFRELPLFTANLCFELFGEIAECAVLYLFPDRYLCFYLITVVLDALLYFCVLAELGRNLLRYNRRASSPQFLAILLFVPAALITFVMAKWTLPAGRSPLSGFYYLLMRAYEILQFAAFLTLAWWSDLQKLRWPERELRVAAGLGIGSVTLLVIAILHTRWAAGPVYHLLDQASVVIYLIVLMYWLHGFWFESSQAQEIPERDAVPARSGAVRHSPTDSKRRFRLA